MYAQTKDQQADLARQIESARLRLAKSTIGPKWWKTVRSFLDSQYKHLCEQLTVHGAADDEGFRLVDSQGRGIDEDFLWRQWLANKGAGPLAQSVRATVERQRRERAVRLSAPAAADSMPEQTVRSASAHEAPAPAEVLERVHDLFALTAAERKVVRAAIEYTLFEDDRALVSRLLNKYATCKEKLRRSQQESWAAVLGDARVIGCTTTGAAKYKEALAGVPIGVVLVEEAEQVFPDQLELAHPRVR